MRITYLGFKGDIFCYIKQFGQLAKLVSLLGRNFKQPKILIIDGEGSILLSSFTRLFNLLKTEKYHGQKFVGYTTFSMDIIGSMFC